MSGKSLCSEDDPPAISNPVLLKVQDLFAAVNMPNYSVLANCISHLSTGTVKVKVDAHSNYGRNVMIVSPPLLGIGVSKA